MERLAAKIQSKLYYLDVIIITNSKKIPILNWLKDDLNPNKNDYYHLKLGHGYRSGINYNDQGRYGRYFLVYPVKDNDKPTKSYKNDTLFHLNERFNFHYIFYFLKNYFNPSIQYKTENFNEDGPQNEFDFDGDLNGGMNLFSYNDIESLLKDIKNIVYFLKNDYFSHQLDEFREYLKEFFIIQSSLGDNFALEIQKDWNENEKDRFVYNNIHYLIKFYEDFIYKMEKMLRYYPNDKYVCFLFS